MAIWQPRGVGRQVALALRSESNCVVFVRFIGKLTYSIG